MRVSCHVQIIDPLDARLHKSFLDARLQSARATANPPHGGIPIRRGPHGANRALVSESTHGRSAPPTPDVANLSRVNAPSVSDDAAVRRRPPRRAASRWFRARHEVLWLFALALVVRATAAWMSPSILNDGATLIQSAERFGREGLSAALSVPDHPLLPWLVSKMPAGVDPETAATVLCVVAGAFAVWPLHVLARRACGRHAATAACIVYAALPKAVGVASTPLTSAVLLPLFLSGLSLAVVAGLPSPRPPRFLGRWIPRRRARLVCAGLACGLAYLCRPEGLVAAAGAVVAAAWFARRGKRLASAAVVAAVFVVVAAPYAVALSEHRGGFALSPKKDVARFVGAAEAPAARSDAPSPAREVLSNLDGALTTPVLVLVLPGLFLVHRWRRRRSAAPRLLLVGLATAFAALVARLHAGWNYGSSRHLMPGALLLLPFAGEGFVVVSGFIPRVVARRRMAVALASFLAIPLAVRSVLRPEGESQVDARRLGERLAETAKKNGEKSLVVATFREPLVAYYADRALRADGGQARDVALWGAFHALIDRDAGTGQAEDAASKARREAALRADLAAKLRGENARWLVVDVFGAKEIREPELAKRLAKDGVLGTPVVSSGAALTAFPVEVR